MTHNHHIAPRRSWLVRYYRWQFRVYLHVLSAVWVIPPRLAAAGFAWLRRTEVPKRGTTVKHHSIRSKIVIPAALVLGTVLVLLVAGCGQRSAQSPVGPAVPGDNVQVTRAPLEQWRVPVTADSHEYAVEFARAIWTYDASKHSYSDWVGGINMFAGAASTSAEVARSMLPGPGEWQQLEAWEARATVTDITAETTPELAKLKDNHGLPQGWHAYVVRGRQSVVLGDETKTVERIAAVSVVCVYTCKFWSGSAQTAS
ncbi:hypothetical protein [Kribbella albertanoniae]|uniref:Uncharacterized protein n=1 Tax=Kribbella albertanoniae TaxID=1266829 RepID=A0A4R4P6E9_9ACTN|nr:hypothetical protein [Kribbella albertanoniae]TDC16403.1 hypothetical protein E1261_39025 [Kribbella albertanoniae]